MNTKNPFYILGENVRYWWVNHKQTHKQEIQGGYIWSPKNSADGSINISYTNLTRTEPNDVIFSYADTFIKGVGVISGLYRSEEKPLEFGKQGKNWDIIGWLVPINWFIFSDQIKPKNFFSEIKPLLPTLYSPLTKYGKGNQRCYLTEIHEKLAYLILSKSSEKLTAIEFIRKNQK